jgi:hypothetical protein
MSEQAAEELEALKRKLWRAGLLAKGIKERLRNVRDARLREQVVKDGLNELLDELSKPLGRQKKQKRAKCSTPLS